MFIMLQCLPYFSETVHSEKESAIVHCIVLPSNGQANDLSMRLLA